MQSTAMVVLAATGRLEADVALFANVGDDSEYPDTVTYVRNVAIPWAAERGLPVHELHRTRRDGTRESLRGRMLADGSRRIPIPMRGSETGAPGRRTCTREFKIEVVGRWLKAHGADKTTPAQTLIGISTDEVERISNRRTNPYEQVRYPLIDLDLDRSACAQVIRDAGLPVPPKSACYFCPFHRPQVWREMRRDRPELFEQSVHLEATVNQRRAELGRDPMYLTRFGRPLDEAIGEAQSTLPGLEPDGHQSCDEGYCWT